MYVDLKDENIFVLTNKGNVYSNTNNQPKQLSNEVDIFIPDLFSDKASLPSSDKTCLPPRYTFKVSRLLSHEDKDM